MGTVSNLHIYLTTELFGHLLHPDIPLQHANLKIADIAAGIEIVLTDLSLRLSPSVQLVAFDSSLDAFPPKEGYHYDTIHVPKVVFVLSDEEIVAIVSKLFKLLEPGGYLQSEEINGECRTAALEEIVRITRSVDLRLVSHWGVGLVDAKTDSREEPGYMDYTFHECVLMVHDMIARKTRNEEVGQRLKKILPEVLRRHTKGILCVDQADC
ncbi:uncharacterized protein BO88DRAFT_429703 [Aspergillus vadensis CBS 113365]|uniref:S-adenosyl-L-methionine-dependent methyltransferase n=1 Tax=Aspergillus vadensis (strain CBS 113365 / IMI 142717 / IBT 24658) TaxID=1448311 RepID=A0A319BEJ2_ASPVC|nr:hypothetical protein BO88DRAFT_429703 [Aspergillus vadensis CBS 113365]PYH64353.1 hypothetical protein BO88DRAFT_429703 [Aspergillus vadensis CBS 113365]